MTLTKIRTLVEEDFARLESLIEKQIRSDVPMINDLCDHLLKSGGKRIRPLIVLLSAHASGYTGNEHILLAAMIEFMHNATLLHDDVVDGSELRRGKQTANTIWGSKASILVGDYLLCQYVELLPDITNIPVQRMLAATSQDICCGEVTQMTLRHQVNLSLDTYLDVIRSKTSLLFAASACIGPMIAQKDQAISNAVYQFGIHLGNAFQLIDDALDYCSSSDEIGKNIGDDLADGKATLPLIHAIKHGTTAQQKLIIRALQQGDINALPEILKAIADTNAIEYTRLVAKQEAEKGIELLGVLPESVYRKGLEAICEFAVNRSH